MSEENAPDKEPTNEAPVKDTAAEQQTPPNADVTQVTEEKDVPEKKEDAPKSKAPQYDVPDNYYDAADKADTDYNLDLLTEHPDHVRERMDNLKATQMPGSEDDVVDYIESLEAAMKHSGFSTREISPFGRDDSEWGRHVDHEGQKISAKRPKIRTGGTMSPDQAVLRARAAAKLGTITSVPLYHTGIWLDQKAPPDSELLDLERRILNEKQRLGRSTTGLTFSNAGVYVNSHLVNSALSHLYNTNYKSDSLSALKEVIKVTDIPTIVWGYASSIWPDGYKLTRPCVADPNTCTYRATKTISIPKLFWVDRRALSTYQKNFLLQRDKTRTAEDLLEYQRNHVVPQSHQFEVGEGFSIRLSVPSIRKHEEAGLRWINSIVDAVDSAFGERMSTKERDSHILRRGTMTSLRRYIHWIDGLVYDNDTVVTDPNTIDEVMDSLSGAQDSRKKILSEIENFMARCTISAIGIPAWTCPSCGRDPQEDDLHPRLGDIIQLEINEIFFTLERIRTRMTLDQA